MVSSGRLKQYILGVSNNEAGGDTGVRYRFQETTLHAKIGRSEHVRVFFWYVHPDLFLKLRDSFLKHRATESQRGRMH